jgi:hypothetical protein
MTAACPVGCSGAVRAPRGASDVGAACRTGRWSVHVERQLIDAPTPCLGEFGAQVPELEVELKLSEAGTMVQVDARSGVEQLANPLPELDVSCWSRPA